MTTTKVFLRDWSLRDSLKIKDAANKSCSRDLVFKYKKAKKALAQDREKVINENFKIFRLQKL